MTETRNDELKKLLQLHGSGRGHRKGRRLRLSFQLTAFLAFIFNRLVELHLTIPVLILATLPVHFVLLMRKLIRGTMIFSPQSVAGSNAKPVTIYYFNVSRPLISKLSLFYHVLSSRLALVGPELRTCSDGSGRKRQACISALKPGIFSLTHVRQASKIGHEGEEAIEWEYVFKKSLLFDTLLLLRTIPTFFFQSKDRAKLDVLEIFGLKIANMTMAEAIEDIEGVIKNDEHRSIFFVNADCLNKIFSDHDYFEILRGENLVLPDGIGLVLAGNMLQTPLKENVNGTDMLPYLCEMVAARGYSLFLLGGQPQVAEEMATRLARTCKVNIAGTHHGYFDRENENEKVVAAINASGADILLVAFGAPLQEKWISENEKYLKPNILMGVGGLFDFYSERTKRAPRWLREIGLEWAFRMRQEPGRMWRRYVIGNPAFLYRVMHWKLYPRPLLRAKSAESSSREAMTGDSGKRMKLIEKIESTATHRLSSPRRAKMAVWKYTVGFSYFLKRVLDITVSLTVLVLLVPLFLVVASLIYIEDPGPIFYSQIRVGKDGRHFVFYKFRSMVMNADKIKEELMADNESDDGVIFKIKDDPRVTRTGRFIRKFSIDELPQLVNVLKGDMSLVGPRPALPGEVAEYTLDQRKRLHTTPGITCIWQVSGRSDIPFSGQVQLDMDYIQSSSFFKDISILLKTIPAVLTGKGAY
ncbi:WecB/TagA/CpsF family glycosyltransferase [Desulforhopalus vacuolatus]|uniref:WecB/TagA/CpsF family glycosyltransferase n=1 Tax=Desulforhopalus vacuolatus TaxID=40414 RepID=UPI0019669716|nr:WecB/TagA/CpsF family glycosyltransferase [Desulforhopalus vacuolatus]MBM9520172.1 WecB/TagA/CpsF family glycosyltransferase [Desulforhopalus vacuolatus]